MSENKNIDVSNLTLFLHSAGSGVVGIKNVIFGTWVLLYYNQVLGLEPYLASIALGVSLFSPSPSHPQPACQCNADNCQPTAQTLENVIVFSKLLKSQSTACTRKQI